MGSIVKSLRERLADAERDCAKGHNNEESAGYDAGFRDAIKEVLQEITGER